MKILAVQPFVDGIGHYGAYSRRLCRDFASRGHKVTLCANTLFGDNVGGPDKFRVVVIDFALRPYEEVRRSRPFLWLFGRIRANLKTLRRALLLSDEVDIIQLFSYELISTALLLTFRPPNRPVVLEIAAPNFESGKHYGGPAERFWRVLQKRAIRHLARHRLSAINVYSPSHADELRRQLALPASFPICVTSDSRPSVSLSIPKAEARLRLGVPSGATIFLFFGTIRRDKGLGTLLEAFARTPGNCHLLIAGKPLDFAPAESGAPRTTERYEFIPESEIEMYFAAADALVLPYEKFYSGSSGPLYDACAYGLPVIASEVSEMGRLVKEHNLGIGTEPGSVRSLADALQQFCELNPAGREKFSENARAFLESQPPTCVADNYLGLYRSLVNRRHVE